MNSVIPEGCVGCAHASKDWNSHPCNVCQNGELYKSTEPRTELSDLEVWRQAYLAALSGYDVAEVMSGFEHSTYSGASSPKELADRALNDYRAKREELRGL